MKILIVVCLMHLCITVWCASDPILCDNHLEKIYKEHYVNCLAENSKSWSIQENCMRKVGLNDLNGFIDYLCDFVSDVLPNEKEIEYKECLKINSFQEVEDEEPREINLVCLGMAMKNMLLKTTES
ncbi:uncharacterized protein [Centruroides vittatus]|uniref:uncharacterized protein n=1 Tax=Centruroides vittatus TaxID=120091 RepID=UPI003510AB41